MKKTFLLICALIASIGVMAQTDLTQGKTVKALGGVIQTTSYTDAGKTMTGVSEANLQNMLKDDASLAILLPQPVGNWSSTSVASEQPVQGFYIELGETPQTIGSVKFAWETADVAALNYQVYLSNTEPSNTGTGVNVDVDAGWTKIIDVTNNSKKEENHSLATAQTGRYIIVQAQGARNVYGTKLKRFQVYTPYVPVLTTLSVSADKTARLVGQTATLTVSAKDQMGNDMEPGAVTWSSSAPAVGTVAAGTFTALAAGTTTITATAGGKEATVDMTVFAAPTNIPAITTTGTVTKIFTSSESAPAYIWDNWGAATKGEGVVINEKNAFMMSDFTYYGSQFTSMDASATTKLHLDVYGLSAGKLTIVPINTGSVEKGTEFTLTVGEWNSLDITIDKIVGVDGVDMTKFFQVKYVGSIAAKGAKGAVDGFENGNGNAFIIGNVYLVTEATEDTEAPVMTKAQATTVEATAAVLTVSATDNASGLLTYKVYNGATELASNTGMPGEDATVTVTGLTKLTEYTLTVKATDKAGNESATGINVNFTTADQFIPATIATAPTADAANVLAVYSATYSKGLNDNNPGWGVGGDAPNPLYTTCEEVTVSEHQMVHVVGKGFNSRTAGAAAATGFTKAYVALYPKTATSGRIFEDNAYNNGVTFSGLTPNQWNYVEVPVAFTANYMLVALDDETEFYLDHFYLKKLGADEMDVTVVGDKAVVIGSVDAADATAIQTAAGNAAVLDMSGATITEDITLTPANKNAVVVVGGTGRTPNTTHVSVSNGNIVVFEAPYYRAAGVITLVDEDASQPNYPFVIDVKDDGVTYSRTIAAGMWASVNTPVPLTAIPDGVKVYKVSTADASSVTLEEWTAGVGANDPVFIHNTNASEVVLTAQGKGIDLNLTANGAPTDVVTGIQMQGTAKAVAADGSQFALKDGEFHPFNAGATIGAFRVCLTGLNPSGARAIFFDGDVTGINSIENGKQKNDDVWYDLQGRRIGQGSMANGQLKPGLYIVNGKKVIIK